MNARVSIRKRYRRIHPHRTRKLIFDDNLLNHFLKNLYLSTVDINKRITSKYYKLLLRRYDINTYTFSKDGIPLMGFQKEFNKPT